MTLAFMLRYQCSPKVWGVYAVYHFHLLIDRRELRSGLKIDALIMEVNIQECSPAR